MIKNQCISNMSVADTNKSFIVHFDFFSRRSIQSRYVSLNNLDDVSLMAAAAFVVYVLNAADRASGSHINQQTIILLQVLIYYNV
jgi:hypothetical protein